MSAPSSYPVWMVKTGTQDMIVNDAISYQNALNAGYSFNTTSPDAVIVSSASVVQTIDETPISAAQPDSVAIDQDQIS